MIVCSCTRISDHDIELALLDILNQPEAPIPTPGVVYRHMQKRMQCCGCAPLAVDVIYARLEVLQQQRRNQKANVPFTVEEEDYVLAE